MEPGGQLREAVGGPRGHQRALLPPNRIPLRTVTTMRMTRDGADVSNSTSTSEVISLTRGPIPASAFVIPDGYREVPFPVPGGDR